MAHFAQIDDNNIVTQVVVIDNQHEKNAEKFIAETLKLGGTWIQTSYNANFRGKFAGIGDTYDKTKDVFVSTQPELEIKSELEA